MLMDTSNIAIYEYNDSGICIVVVLSMIVDGQKNYQKNKLL